MPVSICNSALVKIGVEPITSLSENKKAARLCSILYPKDRDDLLASHFWNFAMSRISLASLPTSPAFGFDYQYQLPTNCLRVRKTDEPSDVWVVEGRKLLANRDNVLIQFIDSNVSPSNFSAHFREALAFRLASELAIPLVQDKTMAKLMWDRYLVALKDARSFDGQEGVIEDLQMDEWMEARLTGTGLIRDVEV